jgi:hypothetical protein
VVTYDINHKLNFKPTDDGLTIVSDWNTRRLYLDEDYHVDRSRTVLALCKYRLVREDGRAAAYQGRASDAAFLPVTGVVFVTCSVFVLVLYQEMRQSPSNT